MKNSQIQPCVFAIQFLSTHYTVKKLHPISAVGRFFAALEMENSIVGTGTCFPAHTAFFFSITLAGKSSSPCDVFFRHHLRFSTNIGRKKLWP